MNFGTAFFLERGQIQRSLPNNDRHNGRSMDAINLVSTVDDMNKDIQ